MSVLDPLPLLPKTLNVPVFHLHIRYAENTEKVFARMDGIRYTQAQLVGMFRNPDDK